MIFYLEELYSELAGPPIAWALQLLLQGMYDLGESRAAGPGFWPTVHKVSKNYSFFEPKLPKRSLQVRILVAYGPHQVSVD